MQLNRCPVCHTRISLDALAQDEAGRELLGLLSKLDTDTGTALVAYLTLFRSSTRDLANDKALRLAKEALGLSESMPALVNAMRITVEQIRGKNGSKLSDHAYLRKVLSDAPAVGWAEARSPSTKADGLRTAQPILPTGKTAQALKALEEFGNGN